MDVYQDEVCIMGRAREKIPAPDMAERLLDWYGRNRRDLPWRKSGDPYSIWISEIMLQQTRVDTAVPFYRRFMKRFPDVETLARAHMQSVLKVWENMGYYARARHLHDAAKTIKNRSIDSLLGVHHPSQTSGSFIARKGLKR